MSTPQEKPKVRPRTATAFEKELWTFQTDTSKTPGSAAGNAGCIAGLGVFMWAVFFGLRFFGVSVEQFFRDSGALLGIVGILIFLLAALSPIIGAVLFLVALVRPKRTVKCPFCLTDHSVYTVVRSYVCTECATVLRIPSDKTIRDLVKVACPICQTKWATPPNAGAMRCFGCGLPVEVSEGQPKVAGGPTGCWSCSAQIHEGVYFCNHCGCLVTEPEELPRYTVQIDLHEMIFKTLPPTTPDGMDVISLRANSAIGFLITALWRAQAVLTRMLDPKALPELSFVDQALHVKALDDAMDFLHETITIKPELAGAVSAALPSFDACLRLILEKMPEKSPIQDANLKAGFKTLLTTLPAKQNALLDRLVELLNLQSEQVEPQKWPQPLMKLKDTGIAIAVNDVSLVRNWASKLTTPSQIGKIRVPEPALISIAKPAD